MSVVSSGFSALGRAFGFSPSGGKQKLPAKKKELGRMSLAELSEQLGIATKQKERFDIENPDFDPNAEVERGTGFARFGGLLGRRKKGQFGRITKRLGDVATARQSLIRRGTAQRAGRATAISTLLGRGI